MQHNLMQRRALKSNQFPLSSVSPHIEQVWNPRQCSSNRQPLWRGASHWHGEVVSHGSRHT
jgi:hypothetical protein